MSDELRLLVYAFDSTGRAEQARQSLEALDARLGGASGHVAVVQRNADGSVRLREPGDIRQELGTLAGQFVGGVTWFVYSFVGLMAPQPAMVADQLTDEAVNRLVRDAGFPDAALHEIGEALAAGQAAVVALIPENERAAAVAELEQLGGKLWEHQLPPAVAADLKSWRSSEA